MDGDWKEAEERVVNLPEDHPDIFKIYVHLLYTGKLAVRPDEIPDNYTRGTESTTLAELYVLAEKLRDVESKDAVITAMIVASRDVQQNGKMYYPGPYPISIIYEGTPEKSLARKFLIDCYTSRDTGIGFRVDDYPKDFQRELLLNVLEKRNLPQDPTRAADISVYMEGKADAKV
jgi:hypothetical protein